MITASVQLSDLYRHLRIDAEYYKPEYLEVESILSSRGNLHPLRKYCNYIKKGIFDISPELYTTEGIPLIRTSEIKNPLVNFSTTTFLDKKTHNHHYKTELKPDDIVMTKIGAYIGDIAILPDKYDVYNFSQNVTGLSVNSNSIAPKYLFAFLLSRFGHAQITRIIMLSGQGKIELEDIRDISVFEASAKFQDGISQLIEVAQSHIAESESLFDEAENVVLSELYLANWQPKHQLAFIKNFSDTEQAERIDAEYYQPKYDEIISAIKSYSGGWDSLGNLLNINDKNFKPENSEEYQYIELSNIAGNGEIIGCTTDFGSELPGRARRIVATGDVIVSSVEGSLSSIALVGNEYDKSLCSTGFYVVNSQFYNAETLLVLLKSIVGKMLLKKGCNGTILTAINKDEFANVVLPKINSTKQLEIQQKVTESFNLRKQSKQLLESTKKAVEMAIKQDEQTAIDWLKTQTKFIGVDDANRL